MYMDMAEVLLYAAEVSTILTFPATLLGIWLAVRPPPRADAAAADTGRVTPGLGARPAVAVAAGTANGYAGCTSAEAPARSDPPRSSPAALPVPKTSSAQVGAVVGGSGDALVPAPGWFLPRGSASCGP